MRVQPARPRSPLTTTVTRSFGEASAAWSAAQRPAPPAPRMRTSVSAGSNHRPGTPGAGPGRRGQAAELGERPRRAVEGLERERGRRCAVERDELEVPQELLEPILRRPGAPGEEQQRKQQGHDACHRGPILTRRRGPRRPPPIPPPPAAVPPAGPAAGEPPLRRAPRAPRSGRTFASWVRWPPKPCDDSIRSPL